MWLIECGFGGQNDIQHHHYNRPNGQLLGIIWLAARVEEDKRADELELLDSQQVAAILDPGGLIQPAR